ncbi:MAG: hypothetical protein ACM3IH_21270 [Sphingobacteriales bacterium]
METKTKTGPVPRAVVEAFYHALANRDMGTLATFLDEQVVWTISGPVVAEGNCAVTGVTGRSYCDYVSRVAFVRFPVAALDLPTRLHLELP